MKSYKVEIMVSLYLLAVVAANFAVAAWGQVALVFTAFVLIPFDLVARDVLHEKWKNNRLWLRMAALIMSGSAISFALNYNVWRVAIASFVAFALAGATNAIVYHWLDGHKRSLRMNVSNFLAAIMDSVIFPLVAFSGLSWFLSASQAVLKFAGGFLWIWLLVWQLKILKEEEKND